MPSTPSIAAHEINSGGGPSPLPMLRMEYFSRPPAREVRWVTIMRLASPAQWHQARAALQRSHIPSLMGSEPEDVAGSGADGAIALQVPEADTERAGAILQHALSGRRWCPRCGSPNLKDLGLPWYWVAWSVLFLGIAPFVPPRWECRQCGKRID